MNPELTIIPAPITDYYQRDVIDAKIAAKDVTLSGVEDVTTTKSGEVWYISSPPAPTLSGVGGVSTTLSGGVWYVNSSSVTGGLNTEILLGGITGIAQFSASGTSITHGLSDLNHITIITPTGEYTSEDAAKVGTVWVNKASTTDTVYCTGAADAVGLEFSWLVTPSGTITNNSFNNILTGSGNFTGYSGTLIQHDLNALNHSLNVIPGGGGGLSGEEVLTIGEIYVTTGLNQDLVYNTGGEASYNLPFIWTASVTGPGNILYEIAGEELFPCIDCGAEGLTVSGIVTATSGVFDNVAVNDTLTAASGVFTEGIQVGSGTITITITGDAINLPDGSITSSSTQGVIIPDYLIPSDYSPPAFQWKDAGSLTIPKGRYYKAGYRHRQHYQDDCQLNEFWSVGTKYDVTVTGTYSVGGAGVLGGKVNNSWYSVFMLGSSEIILLPFVRCDIVTYSAPNTIINPAAHNDGTTAENGFITANDQFNNYRLVKLSFDSYDGNVYTIADSATGTPDSFTISGDKTAEILVTEWLQMIPPSGVRCLYLGTVRVDGSGNLWQFTKKYWLYMFKTAVQINANLSTSAANTEVAAGVPPTAAFSLFTIYGGNNGSVSTYAINLSLCYGTDGGNYGYAYGYSNTDAHDRYRRDSIATRWPMSAMTKIRNALYGWSSTPEPDTNVALEEGHFTFYGFEE